MGSSPIGSTTSCSTITAIHGLLAQSVEQRTVNPRVAGSSPVQPAICPSGGMAYALAQGTSFSVGSNPTLDTNGSIKTAIYALVVKLADTTHSGCVFCGFESRREYQRSAIR